MEGIRREVGPHGGRAARHDFRGKIRPRRLAMPDPHIPLIRPPVAERPRGPLRAHASMARSTLPGCTSPARWTSRRHHSWRGRCGSLTRDWLSSTSESWSSWTAPGCMRSSTPVAARGSSVAGCCSCAARPHVDRIFSLTGQSHEVGDRGPRPGRVARIPPAVARLLEPAHDQRQRQRRGRSH